MSIHKGGFCKQCKNKNNDNDWVYGTGLCYNCTIENNKAKDNGKVMFKNISDFIEFVNGQINESMKEVVKINNNELKILSENMWNNFKEEERRINKLKEEKEMRTTELNIHEIYIALKNMPECTLAKTTIVNNDEIVMLDKNDDLITINLDYINDLEYLKSCYKDGSDDLFCLNYYQLDVLNATFDIIESKEEWIECENVIDAIDKFSEGYNIRVMTVDGEFHPSKDRFIVFDQVNFDQEEIEGTIISKCANKEFKGMNLMFWGNWSYMENNIQ